MKKYLLLILCTLTLAFSSCKKEVIAPETSNRTILFDILAADWKTTDGGYTYFKDISVPENTKNFNDSGQIIVAMSFEDVNVYEGLPQVFQGLSYRFTTDPGFVTIILTDPNGGLINHAPTFDATAKITLIDSQLIN